MAGTEAVWLAKENTEASEPSQLCFSQLQRDPGGKYASLQAESEDCVFLGAYSVPSSLRRVEENQKTERATSARNRKSIKTQGMTRVLRKYFRRGYLFSIRGTC